MTDPTRPSDERVLSVDATKCQAFGTCYQVAPNLFELDEWGFAKETSGGRFSSDQAELARKSIDECPADAIRLVDPNT